MASVLRGDSEILKAGATDLTWKSASLMFPTVPCIVVNAPWKTLRALIEDTHFVSAAFGIVFNDCQELVHFLCFDFGVNDHGDGHD